MIFSLILAAYFWNVAVLLDCQDSMEWNTFYANLTQDTAKKIIRTSVDAFNTCPIGYVTACIIANGTNFTDCNISKVPFRHYLVTRWPVIDILTSIWITRRQQNSLVPHCDDIEHISLNWKSFRSLVLSAMLAGNRDTWNEVLKQVDDIAWKSNSDAVSESGETVKSLTNQCPYGVSMAALLRAWGIALHPDTDTIRIIEGLLHFAQHWLFHMESALLTEWPIVPVMKLLRRARYYEISHAPITLPAISTLQVILVQLDFVSLGAYHSMLSHYDSVGLAKLLYILPLSLEAERQCHTVFPNHCFPIVHSHRLVSKYLSLSLLLKEKIMHVQFVTSDLFRPKGNPFLSAPSIDLVVMEERYSRNFDLSILLFHNTDATRLWMDTVVEWITTYPFASERGGILYLLQHTDPYVRAPAYSYLPLAIPPLTIHKMTQSEISNTWLSTKNGRLPRDAENISNACISNKYHGFVQIEFSSIANDPTCANNRMQDCIFSNTCETQLDDKIVHISFASGCCERDQALCAHSATSVGGAVKSIQMGSSHLSSDFLKSYDNILQFNRTGLMAGKTPSSVTSYYAWKPYIILRALQDYVAWNQVLVYTDAGVHFTSDMRPVLAKYLAVSDVVGASTVMLEAHATKRDAFVALEVEDDSVYLTNQIASCFIAVRKTKKTIELFKWWLAASGCEEVIAETDNVLTEKGNFDGFRFNNDDQVGFSLLMKKFGYTPMHNSEMLSFLSTARNLAKFLAAANNYALGRNATDASEYMQAADANLAAIIEKNRES